MPYYYRVPYIERISNVEAAAEWVADIAANHEEIHRFPDKRGIVIKTEKQLMPFQALEELKEDDTIIKTHEEWAKKTEMKFDKRDKEGKRIG